MVGFGAKFSAGAVDFGDAKFSGSGVGFGGAEFSGGAVSFRGAEFHGGKVSFLRTVKWERPPEFDTWETLPTGLLLPFPLAVQPGPNV